MRYHLDQSPRSGNSLSWKFRKRHPLDCGNPKCQLCHADKVFGFASLKDTVAEAAFSDGIEELFDLSPAGALSLNFSLKPGLKAHGRKKGYCPRSCRPASTYSHAVALLSESQPVADLKQLPEFSGWLAIFLSSCSIDMVGDAQYSWSPLANLNTHLANRMNRLFPEQIDGSGASRKRLYKLLDRYDLDLLSDTIDDQGKTFLAFSRVDNLTLLFVVL